MGRIRNAIAGAVRGWKISSSDLAMLEFLSNGSLSESGVSVSEESAMRLATVYACIQKISKTVAQIPRHVKSIDRSGSQRITKYAIEHPLYNVIHRRPNPYQTAYEFFLFMQWQVTSNGNAYAQIERNQAGRIKALWPWPTSQVRVEEDGWNLKYYFQTKQGEQQLPQDQVFHLTGLCTRGRMGLSPIQAARETLGEGIALQQHSARMLKNGMRSSGIIEEPPSGGFKTEEDRKTWVKRWQDTVTGENSYKVALLKPGMKFTPTTVSNDDAQWIDIRKFSRREICAIYDVPPHLVGDLEQATFSNIEQQSLEYMLYCIAPWLINWEQKIELQLLETNEVNKYSIKNNFDGLLRGDSESRWNAYWRAMQVGAKSPNEIRELEDENPYDGGDAHYVMSNMAALDRNGNLITNKR